MKMKMKKPEEKCIERYMDDFELWCEECVTIYDKLTGQTVPLRLNAPQRRVAMIMGDATAVRSSYPHTAT